MATESASVSERMAIRASQELADGDLVFVGIGLPNLACNLARRTHAPNLTMIYESGAVGAVPDRLPVSIGDPALVCDSLQIVSQADIFQCFLQRGLIQVGLLGGAQIDPWGNLNTTVIGDYAAPKVRLPGSGGACEIAVHAQRLVIVMRMTPRSFVPRCDFVTSPGQRSVDRRRRRDLGLPGGGPTRVVTDLGVLDFDTEGEAVLAELYAGVSVADVQAACGWKLRVAPSLRSPFQPAKSALRLLRDVVDPGGLYS